VRCLRQSEEHRLRLAFSGVWSVGASSSFGGGAALAPVGAAQQVRGSLDFTGTGCATKSGILGHIHPCCAPHRLGASSRTESPPASFPPQKRALESVDRADFNAAIRFSILDVRSVQSVPSQGCAGSSQADSMTILHTRMVSHDDSTVACLVDILPVTPWYSSHTVCSLADRTRHISNS
jgi:hypothetical protein